MYSPKIDEALIPRIYLAAKAANVPMTLWVNRAIQDALANSDTEQSEPVTVLDRGTTGEPEPIRAFKVQVPA